MRRHCLILVVLITAALMLTACNGKTIKINADDNGTTIEMKKGETLVLSITGNPTTGYTWEIESVDQNILQSAGEADYKSDSMLIGSGGTYKFKFTALNPGSTPLKLKYWRSFDHDNPPVETFEVKIVVK